MTLVKIDKKNWAGGLTAAADAYRLYAPVKEKDYHQFKALADHLRLSRVAGSAAAEAFVEAL